MRCNSTVHGHVSINGVGEVVTSIKEWRHTGCTSATVHVLETGSLSIAPSGGGNGLVKSTGHKVTVETFGAHCIYATNNTALGTITGGSPATLDISVSIPRTGGKSGVFCGSSAPLTGSYEVTAPNPLFVS